IVAIMIDLMIPATTMKKYIKLVVGLILILIFLKPVFALFEMNIDQALENSFSKVMQEKSEQDTMENSIKMQKSEIEDGQRAYILEEMAVQLKDLAKKRLKEEEQAEILNIDFRFQSDAEPSYENLDEVIVYLGHIEEEEGAVDIVEDVEINTKEPVADDDDEQDVGRIKHVLHDVWDISEDKLTIEWEGGST